MLTTRLSMRLTKMEWLPKELAGIRGLETEGNWREAHRWAAVGYAEKDCYHRATVEITVAQGDNRYTLEVTTATEKLRITDLVACLQSEHKMAHSLYTPPVFLPAALGSTERKDEV